MNIPFLIHEHVSVFECEQYATGTFDKLGICKKIVSKKRENDKIKYFVENSNTKKFVPAFLIETDNKNIEIGELLNGLKLVSNYLEKNILIPNNINQPVQRTDFINLLK